MGWGLVNTWMYSRWIRNISRNSRITNPSIVPAQVAVLAQSVGTFAAFPEDSFAETVAIPTTGTAIVSSSVTISFAGLNPDSAGSLTDDGLGILDGTYGPTPTACSGTINYATGEWTVDLYPLEPSTEELVFSADYTYLKKTELVSVLEFLKYLWNPVAQTGTRSWLDVAFRNQSVGHSGDLDLEPDHVLVALLDIAGRDLKKTPMSLAEKAQADILIAATGVRRLGTGPLFGSTSGSVL